MPISRKRKKKGRKVGSGTHLKVDPNKPSSLTLQNLINIVAYQEANPEEAAGNEPKVVDVISEGEPPVYGAIDKIAEQKKENEDGR